jgi:adenine deaminase
VVDRGGDRAPPQSEALDEADRTPPCAAVPFEHGDLHDILIQIHPHAPGGDRHRGTGRRSVGFVKGFGLRRGAIATSINHDSHNAIVIGADEAVMAAALNRLREIDGGIVVASDVTSHEALPLPIGGLMCDRAPDEVAASLERLRGFAKTLGCALEEPFIQLSFLALPVIPSLKITDRGLVDVEQFQLVGAVL